MYDAVFNPKIIEKCDKEQAITEFLITLVSQRLNQKHEIEVMMEHTKLMKNFKYKGKQVRMQRVRAKKGPKIEEILEENKNRMQSLNNENEKISKNISNKVNEQGQVPDWNFFIYRK